MNDETLNNAEKLVETHDNISQHFPGSSTAAQWRIYSAVIYIVNSPQ